MSDTRRFSDVSENRAGFLEQSGESDDQAFNSVVGSCFVELGSPVRGSGGNKENGIVKLNGSDDSMENVTVMNLSTS